MYFRCDKIYLQRRYYQTRLLNDKRDLNLRELLKLLLEHENRNK